ncbi:RecQ family ATP-dependent DNA helicase [Segatella albensis]|uniref:RecQ family ATP-dependent DNA helicase n=1 Tax=Segatella albensis TaxID=77768 RepID=UPI0003FB64AB|nr:RecQ family ATP-dependent DNA helicase [Segatella albensis]
MIAFIDTEVNPQTKKVADYGAVREDGAVLHSHSKADFDAFVSKCDTVCGHNIINFDLKYISLRGNPTIVDTLFLSPLLFPKRPYHHLVKDDKLQVDELNNPVNDSIKARDLLNDEVVAWNQLSDNRKEIYFYLLKETQEFGGFFKYIGYSPNVSWISAIFASKPDWKQLILKEYEGEVCSHTDFETLVKQYPIELAYCLAVIGADDIFSITPAWVIRNYPQVVNVMNMLCNTSCGDCEYCHQRLDAHYGLKEFFGYDKFRIFDGVPMQQQAVESAIRGESLLTIFPTGGGKSLTFQLPALMAGRNSHGLTVVISPLQSLMKDQVDNLAARGISDAVTINGLLDPIERATAIEQVADGTANLLYIAPEMLRSKTIERLLMGRHVVRFVIDEAHCFSAWGHDFRVDYLYIGDFIRQLQEKKQLEQPIAVSCFTATAKQKVISDICDYFRAKLGLELKVFAANAERKNLRYSVLHADTADEKYNLLRSLILGHNCPSIVYVSRTKRTRELAQHLVNDGIRALPFNGKMESAEKVKNQNAFMSGDVQVIVATSAFGMGVDKKDVGLVVHYNISDSLENYVQEAGRAGRDPQMQAECYVLFADSDLDKHFILLNQTKLSISEIQQVWKAIKDLTAKRDKVSCSPLDIARQAGWGEDVEDIETRVKAAIAALEDAGYIQRGSNSPHVFATGIAVKNMDEARRKLTVSPLFDEQSREEAARIIKSLISARATAEGRGAEAESRVDYLADILGMSKATVIRNINLMRQDGLLADSRDMQAWISKSTSRRNLDIILKLEQFLLQRFGGEAQRINLKELNEEAQKVGLTYSNVKRLRMLLHFLSLKGYIHKQEHSFSDSLSVRLQASQDVTKARFERRMEICRFITETLNVSRDPNKEMTLVNFSIVELLQQFISSRQESMFADQEKPVIADIEEALLYLTKTELMKIEGGFIVIYNTMQIGRIADRRTRYGKEQYRLLDEFYKQRIRQIHIVGEYANLMVRDYNAALRFVNDYFTMDFRKFINQYFKEERRAQIDQNITPAKYNKLFGELSNRQCEIIDDKESKYIVVAAGPGSGKTRVLVHKLASLLLLEDVKHEQLLMLTFSRAAATEFKKRLIDLVGNAANYVEIKTFHSYSFDLIGKQGNLDEAKDVVRRAAEMIENGEVEQSKIAKSVLVIDEAQDMDADDFRLVQALMHQNEEMRVIAVGDDDQNIYAFRGSDSRYMQSLVSEEGAKLYEMTDNYRSSKVVVDCANRFVQRIPSRMKRTPIQSATGKDGKVLALKSLLDTEIKVQGSTAILTRTNEETMQVAYELEQRGLHATVAQSMGGFRFCNLAEVRYFLKHLDRNEISISKEKWQEAKQRTFETYASSTCLNVIKHFFADFEATRQVYYRSDLREFIFESNIEDFIAADDQSVFVSTIHKAKGREFDTVYLLSPVPDGRDINDMRAYYVGLTRAKRNLYLVTNPPTEYSSISIALNMHDVILNFFKGRKDIVLRLRSGDNLQYKDGYLQNENKTNVAALSASGKDKLKVWTDKDYEVTSAKVSYTLAWKPQDSETEYAVCLANIVLSKTDTEKENYIIS